MTTIETVLVKLASRCNLDCSYCYVYRMGDDGWRSQPKRMSPVVSSMLARRLADLAERQDRPFGVVFHGGEPLLVGPDRFEAICGEFKRAAPGCELSIQTNGVLLDERIVETCIRYDVGVSVSIDGPAAVHDRNRRDHRGRPSHSAVSANLARLTATPEGRAIFSGVLAVVDPSSDPIAVYEALKSTCAPTMDLLCRDGNHDFLPPGKSSIVSTEYGDWMCRLLDHYLADPRPTPVRVLDDMLKLMLGGGSSKEGLGTDEFGILVIETDGTIAKNDTLKSAHSGADRFGTSPSIDDVDLFEFVRSETFASHRSEQVPTARECGDCPFFSVCGGGMPAHRWSAERGFENPTVFCADQIMLIDRMRQHLRRNRLAA